MRSVILASTSPRRKKLFKKLGIPFRAVPPNYMEDMLLNMPPGELAKYLSWGKAEAVACRHKNAIVIGVDTFLAIDGHIIGKPKNALEAVRTIKRLSGRAHTVISGFTIIDTKRAKRVSRTVETKVYFRALTDTEVRAYVKTGEPLGKAGSYAIQGKGAALIRKIKGDYDNVVGLPLAALARELKKFGVKV